LRERLTALAKLAVSVSLVAYLIYDVQESDPTTFARLRHEPKDWSALAAAWICFVAALVLGWLRWRALAARVGVRMHITDAMRLGFFGYMLDFLMLGTIGGDAGRAVLMAREHGKRWAEALASVAADRLLGLWALSSTAAVAVAVAFPADASGELVMVARAVFAVAAASSLALGLLMVAPVREALVAAATRVLPSVGAAVARTLESLAAYRGHNGALLRIAAASLAIPFLNVSGFYLTARALPLDVPTFAEHFVIIPPAMVTGAVPLPMEALGVFEYAFNFLYAQALGADAAAGTGLLVALAYRGLTILTILVGAPLYAWARAGR
jgi:hypothetical protein